MSEDMRIKKVKSVKPAKFRKPARPYRLVIRKKSRFIAVRIGKKQRSSKECEPELARAFAYRWIAESYPRLAHELGIEITPELKPRAGEQESRRAGEQESRRAGEQESRRAGNFSRLAA